MSLFLGGLFVLGLAALLIFVPFTRNTDWNRNYRQQQNILLYQQQMAHNRSPALADEFARRLLADEKQLQNRPHFSVRQNGSDTAAGATAKSALRFCPKTAGLLFVLLFGLPLLYYFSLNRFDYAVQGERDFIAAQQKRKTSSAPEKNDDYIITVQNRLRQDPNDGEAWIELGQAYMFNNEFEHALQAYANAEGLLGSKPHILSLAATALYYQAGQKITAKTQQLLDEALRQDPSDTAALSLLASDAFLTADYAEALRLWQRILDSERSNIDRRTIIGSMQLAEQLKRARNP